MHGDGRELVLTRHRLTPEQRQRRRDNGRKGALARAELYRTGKLKRQAIPKKELKRRRYHELRAEGRCVWCRGPAAARAVCRECANVRNLKCQARKERA